MEHGWNIIEPNVNVILDARIVVKIWKDKNPHMLMFKCKDHLFDTMSKTRKNAVHPNWVVINYTQLYYSIYVLSDNTVSLVQFGKIAVGFEPKICFLSTHPNEGDDFPKFCIKFGWKKDRSWLYKKIPLWDSRTFATQVSTRNIKRLFCWMYFPTEKEQRKTHNWKFPDF